MCTTEELLQKSYRSLSQEKEFVYISQRRHEETEGAILRVEQQYKIKFRRIYGEDYEQVYLEEEERRRKERTGNGGIL